VDFLFSFCHICTWSSLCDPCFGNRCPSRTSPKV